MNRPLICTVLGALTCSATSQQIQWQAAGGSMFYATVDPFVDYDGDGRVDLMVGAIANWGSLSAHSVLRVVSGATGAVLHERNSSRVIRVLGDMDGDGQRDYADWVLGTQYTRRLQVRRWPSGTILWAAEGPGDFGFNGDTSLTADLDITGDGRPDIVLVSGDPQNSYVRAYDNGGAMLFETILHPYGWVANNVTAMPDLDGDGSQDFLLGCVEPSGRGAVVVVSGRTHAPLRVSYGLIPGDYIGGSVCNAGDVDQDGMVDYAAASSLTSPLLSIVIFSGRTGAVIHSWNDYFTSYNGMTGGVDVDLDGIPDLIVGSSNQVRAYSGRDASVLWNLDFPVISSGIWPWPVFNLGTSPSNPYPFLGFQDNRYNIGTSINRIIVFGANLPGVGPITGNPCSSLATPPRIGMRKAAGLTRITVSDAPPGALAWLVGAHASQTTFEGAALPYALDPFGLFGCTAYVPPVVVVPTVVGTTGLDRGYAAIDLPWPILSATGTAFAAQWLLLDPSSGAYALTPRHEFAGR